MDDRAALLAAVCDRPDDDTPRLVFADWLDDHGDADYARFIRAQIELSRVPEWDRTWVRAWHRDPDLLTGRQYHDRFALPAEFQPRLEFRRGFPWGVYCATARVFAEAADELFARAPVQLLGIGASNHGPLEDVTPLATNPQSARLRHIGFTQTFLHADAVRWLAESPHLAGVTELTFGFDALIPEGGDELFRSGLVGRLTGLRLVGTFVPPAALGGDYGPGALRSLTLSGAALGPALADLFDRPLFRGLVELDLSCNRLGPRGFAALAASSVTATLVSLILRRTGPTVAGIRALAADPGLVNLRRLGLCDCRLGFSAVKALADSPHLRNLTVLDLSQNAIGDKGALAIAASPHLRNLADLNLTGAGLTDRGVAALLDSPVTAGLVRLGVSGNLSVETFARVRERFG
jgi:uncharacterized protein (TIGR02996 family)